jgi:hypothetical protein
MIMTIIKQKLNNQEKKNKKLLKSFSLIWSSTHVYSKTIFLIERNKITILQNI